MFWEGLILDRKHVVTLSLFLIAALHSMIFAIFQLPDNFLMAGDPPSLTLISKSLLYFVAITTSLINPYFGRKIGLRMTLYMGLWCNILGIFTLILRQTIGGGTPYPFAILNVFFFGIALTSVINCLVTYIILEFPKKVGLGVVVLFAFLNIGLMLAPIFLDVFVGLHITRFANPFLIALVALSLWFVRTHFPNPEIPHHLAHLKKGTLLWKELHYRLALYVIAIICYGLTETTFSLWGISYMEALLGAKSAEETSSLFWLFMVIAQLTLLIPLYFYRSIQVLMPLVLIVISAALAFPFQDAIPGFISALAAAGLGCSAIFPLLLSMMEKELFSFKQKGELLHYLEIGISVMIAGYLLGVGTVDLWVEMKNTPSPFYFHLAAIFISITGLIAYFLNKFTRGIRRNKAE